MQPKFLAVNCMNFKGADITCAGEENIRKICTTPNCADGENCDGEIIEKMNIPETQVVHFVDKRL